MKYIYQARSKEGKIETGIIEASSKEAAADLLQKYNIFVTSIKEKAPVIWHSEKITFLHKVSKKDLAIFSRELAVMVQSRIQITQSLRVLAIQTKNKRFQEQILKIAQWVEEGSSLSAAFATFPDTFNLFYVSVIRTGEASGKISDSLYSLSEHLEKEYDISAQIRGALIYPAFVISLLLVVIPMIIIFVLPKLVDLLKQIAIEPPLFTRIVITFYSFLLAYGWILLTIFAGTVIFLVYYFTTKEGKIRYDEWSLKTPFLSEFLKKVFLVRFAENISALISAGLSINAALKITKDTVGNHVYQGILTETEERVSQGEKISSVLAKYPDYAPPFVVQMVQVGEETGTLDKNLMEIVNFYGKEIQRAIDTFTSLIEPAMIIILGAVVALLAISVIEPLYGTLGAL